MCVYLNALLDCNLIQMLCLTLLHFSYCGYGCSACGYAVYCVQAWCPWVSETVLDPLGLTLQMVVRCCVDAGNQTQVLCRIIHALISSPLMNFVHMASIMSSSFPNSFLFSPPSVPFLSYVSFNLFSLFLFFLNYSK